MKNFLVRKIKVNKFLMIVPVLIILLLLCLLPVFAGGVLNDIQAPNDGEIHYGGIAVWLVFFIGLLLSIPVAVVSAILIVLITIHMIKVLTGKKELYLYIKRYVIIIISLLLAGLLLWFII